MRQALFHLRSAIIAFALLVALVACNVSPTSFSTPQPPTALRGLTPSSFPTFRPTFPATRTRRPTATATPGPSPTDTTAPLKSATPQRLPTLPPATAAAVFATNTIPHAACDLPCWWGVTPGKTSIEQARAAVEPAFGYVDFLGTFDRGSIYYYQAAIGKGPYDRQIYAVISHTVDYIDIDAYDFTWAQLSNVLAAYGSPSGIGVNVAPDAPDNSTTIRLALFYASRGLLFFYGYSYNHFTHPTGGLAVACPGDFTPVSFVLWAPGPSVPDISSAINLSQVWHGSAAAYFLLEDVSALTVAEFVNSFGLAGNSDCLSLSPDPWLLP